jgi:hypothetical protein
MKLSAGQSNRLRQRKQRILRAVRPELKASTCNKFWSVGIL